ncbi:hypothetical protein BO71DRAFT_225683 [Aspergillus ellipticus CBS 707.79]|uniref:WD40 repeat-like protein n=1 Tax=Aspergillus ellipticus CBS 707.79 TaxID=1448320 RepID=A0A319DC23_9EURO|nr:hypothetical protein BO71DRAFT_225683 [Aspergillus ellipticus CBS 707.79]
MHRYMGALAMDKNQPIERRDNSPLFESDVKCSPSLSPDGKLRFLSRDKMVTVWDPDIKTLQLGMIIDPFILASFSPCGKLLCTVSENKNVQVWDLTYDSSSITLDGVDLDLDWSSLGIAWPLPTGSHVMIISKWRYSTWEVSTGILQNRMEKLADTSPDDMAISPD